MCIVTDPIMTMGVAHTVETQLETKYLVKNLFSIIGNKLEKMEMKYTSILLLVPSDSGESNFCEEKSNA